MSRASGAGTSPAAAPLGVDAAGGGSAAAAVCARAEVAGASVGHQRPADPLQHARARARQRGHMATWAAATAASAFGSEPAAKLIRVASSR